MLIKKQIQTERGLVFVKERFRTRSDAEQAGYHPAFFSSKLNLELYSKVLDTEGHHYDFAVIGGCLVKQHYTSRELLDFPSLASCYDVFWCQPSEEKEDMHLAAMCMIDLDSYKEDPLFQGDQPCSDEELAVRVAEYYGVLSLSGRTYSSQYPTTLSDAELSYDELCQWLQQIGADEYIPEEYIQKIAYERYKVEWLGRCHLTMRLISDTVEDFNNYLKECRQLGESKTDYSFADYVNEFGFRGGTIWVCFDEFCGAKYLNEGYMEGILNAADFTTYKVLREKAVS